MCRIAGILGFSNKDTIKQRVSLMTNAMHRGGPDDEGFYMDKLLPVAYGHRRLSLIDLSSLGHQPMQDDKEEIVITYNGEIYNYIEIRNELIALGYHFKSHSDTEVIIYAYKQWGVNSFNKLNGMFAFSLLDKINKKALLVRDYAGIKPLYYSYKNGELIFASEIRAFKTLEKTWSENTEWKKYFLLFGFLPEPITTLQNVQPLAKGSYLEFNLNTNEYSTKEYFNLSYNYIITNEDEAIEKVRAVLTKAVQRHLISDAPIGLFLSGGIDSSLLTLLAKPTVGDNLKTLSIVFEDAKFSEKKYQDIIIEKTGAHHHSFLINQPTFFDYLPDILEAMDQPSCDGINSYFITKYAKEYGLTAVLSGLGADEIFGGYQSFYRTKQINLLKKLPNIILALANIHPDDRIKRISFLNKKSVAGDYLLNRGFYTVSQVANMLDCSVAEVRYVYENSLLLFPDYVNKLDEQEKVSYYERNCYMQNQLLKDTDYMSMWHSVEVRVPFLDKELLELVYSIRPSIRYNAQCKKHLLIKAFKNILPEEIWNRKKQGFTFPFESWMKHFEPINKKAAQQHKLLLNNKLHWSKYWCYMLSDNSFKQQFLSKQ
ncbi:MAG: asparagine synthase (glutamine-hydrolyzing) [Chitinophagaceae bacterium]|nr:asparagine synthase (glutamine-hydrolyzing) [Chitinophagaceae bacterium]MCW5905682.1 asparagine synthase (glutamine-hydrolyzing) [Chitinophagaceae bacterium]